MRIAIYSIFISDQKIYITHSYSAFCYLINTFLLSVKRWCSMLWPLHTFCGTINEKNKWQTELRRRWTTLFKNLYCRLRIVIKILIGFDLIWVYYDLSSVQVHNALYKFFKSHWMFMIVIALWSRLR